MALIYLYKQNLQRYDVRTILKYNISGAAPDAGAVSSSEAAEEAEVLGGASEAQVPAPVVETCLQDGIPQARQASESGQNASQGDAWYQEDTFDWPKYKKFFSGGEGERRRISASIRNADQGDDVRSCLWRASKKDAGRIKWSDDEDLLSIGMAMETLRGKLDESFEMKKEEFIERAKENEEHRREQAEQQRQIPLTDEEFSPDYVALTEEEILENARKLYHESFFSHLPQPKDEISGKWKPPIMLSVDQGRVLALHPLFKKKGRVGTDVQQHWRKVICVEDKKRTGTSIFKEGVRKILQQGGLDNFWYGQGSGLGRDGRPVKSSLESLVRADREKKREQTERELRHKNSQAGTRDIIRETEGRLQEAEQVVPNLRRGDDRSLLVNQSGVSDFGSIFSPRRNSVSSQQNSAARTGEAEVPSRKLRSLPFKCSQ